MIFGNTQIACRFELNPVFLYANRHASPEQAGPLTCKATRSACNSVRGTCKLVRDTCQSLRRSYLNDESFLYPPCLVTCKWPAALAEAWPLSRRREMMERSAREALPANPGFPPLHAVVDGHRPARGTTAPASRRGEVIRVAVPGEWWGHRLVQANLDCSRGARLASAGP